MRKIVSILLCGLMVVLAANLLGCSGSDEPEKKSELAKKQEEIAAEAVASIKTPIDQAKLAKELTEQHNKDIEEKIKQQ